jgi:hypothetical protein
MGDQFSVSPDNIRSSAEQFENVANTAGNIVTNLLDTVQGNPTPAGNDEYGTAFLKNLQPALDAANQVLTGVQTGFTSTNTNLQYTADMYDKANGVNTELAGKVL